VTPREPGGPSRAKQRRGRERDAARAAILAAARDLGRCEGWDAVTMRALADRLEYSANFAYRYFSGRDDILLSLVRGGFSQLRDAMSAAARDEPRPTGRTRSREADEWAAIRRAGHAYLDFAIGEPDLYQLMYGVGGTRVPATDAWAEGQAVGDVLIGLLRAAGDSDAERHVLQLWAAAHGLVTLAAVGRVVGDAAALHAIADDAISDVLARATTPSPARAGQGAGR
jgi:AcrR family transcriptional regulator